MFEGLRKKFSEVIKGFVKKEEEVAEQKAGEAGIRPQAAEPLLGQEEAVTREKIAEKPSQKPEPRKKGPMGPGEKPRPELGKAAEPVEKPKEQPKAEHGPAPKQEPKAEKKEEAIKLSLITKVKKAVFGSVVLSEGEIDRFLSGLRISMLESDVAFDVAEIFIGDLGDRLKGKRIESRSINEEVVAEVRQALLDTLQKGAPQFSFTERVKARGADPFVILFLGPNGTGKTTTIAKIASRLKREGVGTVIAAGDTFRAAAIEQIEHHANRIGVPIIKSAYGADPASIAFDAVAYARARGIDTVLIDSAGRQETNPSLIREMEKMVRVAKPSMIVFVGESTAGNAIANQITEFGKHMKIDGIVLTKLDCDAKGGGALSISHLTGIPILFFGVGEGYDALVDYTPEFIADAIVPRAK